MVQVFCALLLTKYHHHAGILTREAFPSGRNDAFADIAIMQQAC